MLSTKLARRARPPLGVCQPQGLVFPLTSVVERMMSLPGWSVGAVLGAVAPARTSQARIATTEPASILDARGFMKESLRVEFGAGHPAELVASGHHFMGFSAAPSRQPGVNSPPPARAREPRAPRRSGLPPSRSGRTTR